MSLLISRPVKLKFTVRKVLYACILALQGLAICVLDFSNYGQMCLTSVAQLALFVIMALASSCRQPFTILFLVANWIFNCGQIVCIAAGYDDVLNLDFRQYGSQATISLAFRFYLYSQTLIAAGALFFQKSLIAEPVHKVNGFGAHGKTIAKIFVVVGLPFWLYVNVSRMVGAAADAYRGVYSLVIPAFIQALAFFFEAGLLMLLLIAGKERKGALLFWSVVALKIVIMSTGGRQDSVCFLAIWFIIYFCYLRKLTIKQAVGMVLSAVFLLFAIDAFGELRTEGFSFEALSSYLADASLLDVFWDSLGEFGCAFSTLVVSMAHVPDDVAFGAGGSYLAGILSIVPTLVGNFPNLEAAVQFTSLLPGTRFLGGSMLGEFYFNFGWFGLVGPFLVGAVVAWCQNRFNEYNNHTERGVYVWAAAVLAMFLLLFIRGYFTDAIMKIAYVFLFAWIVNDSVPRVFKRKRCDISENPKVVVS